MRKKAVKWTEEDLDQLKKLYGTISNKELGEILNRSPQTISCKAHELNIRNRRKFWSQEEINYLNGYYNSETCKRIGLKLNRSAGSVQVMAQKLGITNPNRTRGTGKSDVKWTKEENQYLITHYKKLTADKISQNINRTISSIYHRANELKLMGRVKASLRRKSLTQSNYYEWRELCRIVNKRDGNKCKICGYSKHVATHHIQPVREGGSDTQSNLITLCPNHHAEADAGELTRPYLSSLMPLHIP